jgi:hypothetical protein
MISKDWYNLEDSALNGGNTFQDIFNIKDNSNYSIDYEIAYNMIKLNESKPLMNVKFWSQINE